MKLEVRLTGASNKEARIVELERNGDGWLIRLDGQPVQADVVQIDAATLSVLLEGRSYTFQVTQPSEGLLKLQTPLREFMAEVSDPRAWRGRRHGAAEAQGRQQVIAPMPGKVIRVLVNPGDKVEAGQGLLVVEAMKMQNEIRSPKTGTVERLLAKEGQPVNAGEVLCVVS
jgi:biotin carboxyl carrier protein